MKTITINTYSFDELTIDAKLTAIDEFRYIHIDGNWYENIIEELTMFKLSIRTIKFDHPNYDFNLSIMYGYTIENVIEEIKKHVGEHTTLYKIASLHEQKLNHLRDTKYNDDNNYREWLDEKIEIQRTFLQFLEREYTTMFINEYNYLTSCECIGETLDSMDYQFASDGTWLDPVLEKLK